MAEITFLGEYFDKLDQHIIATSKIPAKVYEYSLQAGAMLEISSGEQVQRWTGVNCINGRKVYCQTVVAVEAYTNFLALNKSSGRQVQDTNSRQDILTYFILYFIVYVKRSTLWHEYRHMFHIIIVVTVYLYHAGFHQSAISWSSL